MLKGCFVLLSFALLVCFFVGCATAKSGKDAVACRDECNLNHMTCLEEFRCTAPDGQRIPCEEECGIEKQECLDNC